MDLVQRKIRHLKKHFGFTKEELIEISKMYSLAFFDPKDKGVQKLYQISKDLCEEYNALFVIKASNKEKRRAAKKRQKEILSLLFPGHGLIAECRSRLSAVIGLVDIKSNNFINVGAHFSPYSYVILEPYTQFGADVEVGLSKPIQREDGKIRLGKLELGASSWLCSKAKADFSGRLGEESVLAAGAYLYESCPAKSLITGRPAKVLKTIGEEKPIKPQKIEEKEVLSLYDHYKKMGYRVSKKKIHKMLDGSYFSTIDIRLGFLYLKTHELCHKLDGNISLEEREEILNLLFPNHGKNLRIGKGFFLDLAGTVKLGDNVTIGDNVSLGGKIKIGNNVTLGDGVSIFSSNHPLNAKKRKPNFSLKRGLYIDVRFGENKILDGVTIGKNTVVIPEVTVKEDIKENGLVLRDKTIF